MLGAKAQLRLADFMKALADLEAAVEVTRQILAEKKGFEPQATFKHLDVSNRGFISVSDLLNFLNEFDLFPLEEEVKNLIINYDSNEDLRLSYSDFEKMVLPTTNPYIRQLAISREAYKLQGLSHTSAWALARVIEKEIVENRKIEILRQSLVELPDWDITEAFLLVDGKDQGHLTAFSVLEYLRNNDIVASYDDALAFIRRADKDEDGKVSYREFVKILQSKYQARSQTSSSTKNKPSYKYIESPSPRKNNNVDYKLNSLQSPKKEFSNFEKRYQPKAIGSRWQLTDKHYGEYIDNSAKNPASGGRVTSVAYSQEKSQHLWPSTSKNPELLSRKYPYSARKTNIDTMHSRGLDREQQSFGLQDQKASKSSISPSNKRQTRYRRSSDLKYENSQNIDRRSKKEETISRNEYDISRLRIESSDISTSKYKEPHRYQREDHDITKTLKFEEKTAYSNKRRDIRSQKKPEIEEEYDFTGYRTTLGKGAQVPESQDQKLQDDTQIKKIEEHNKNQSSNDLPYNTPRKKEPQNSNYPEKKLPAEYVISPRKERSPGKHAGAKTLSDKSLIKGYEEEFLVKSIKTLIEYERELQLFKSDLALKKDFSIITSFRKLINEAGEDSTNQTQFEENLKKLGVFLTQTEIEAVFSRFDNDGDGIISLKDYEHLVVPTNREHARVLREKDVREELSDRTLKQILNFVKKFALIESQIEDSRVRISKRFSLEDAFKAIDTNEKGLIDSRELKEILTYHGVFPTEKDLQNIINKMDIDNDGKLSIQEFTKSFSPQKGSKQTAEEHQKVDEKEHQKVDEKEQQEELESTPQKETQERINLAEATEVKEKAEESHQEEEKNIESTKKEIPKEISTNEEKKEIQEPNLQQKENESSKEPEEDPNPKNLEPKIEIESLQPQKQEEIQTDAQAESNESVAKGTYDSLAGENTEISGKIHGNTTESEIKDDISTDNQTIELNENV